MRELWIDGGESVDGPGHKPGDDHAQVFPTALPTGRFSRLVHWFGWLSSVLPTPRSAGLPTWLRSFSPQLYVSYPRYTQSLLLRLLLI
jgi:hypothetical protein